MKKIYILIALLLLVTACGKESKKIDINKASIAIEESLNDMVNIEGDTLENVYGVSLSNIEEFIVKQNGEGDMYAIIKTKDKSKVAKDMERFAREQNLSVEEIARVSMENLLEDCYACADGESYTVRAEYSED